MADSTLTPDLLEKALAAWDQLAFFAFNHFTSSGRGIAALEHVPGEDGTVEIRASYITYPPSLPDSDTAHLLAEYDPEHEILVMYREHSGTVHTMRLRTEPDARNPKRVWFFEVLRRLEEEPEAVPEHIPDWFWEALKKIEISRDKPDP